MFERRVHRDDEALHGAAVEMRQKPVAHFRRDENRPHALQGIDRHPRCGEARRQTQVAAGKFRLAGHGDADLGVADVAAFDHEALVGRIVLAAEGDAVEHQSIAGKVGRIEHDRAVADLEQPDAAGLLGGADFAQQRDPVAAGNDLQRRHQDAVRRVPIQLDLGMVDIDAAVGAAGLADEAGFGNDPADQAVGHAIGAEFTAQACRQRQIGFEIAVVEAGREQKIARRDMAGFELDAARAVARRLDRRRQSPWPLGIARTDGDDDTAAMRPLQTERDVLEVPVLAGARVVDVEVAVLEAQLAQIVAVESGLADAVDPRQ